MARSRHRKGHREASSRRSALNRLKDRLESPGRPVEVGKNRFRILPDFEEGTTVTMNGQTVPATVTNDGKVRLESAPEVGVLLQADYRPLEERVLRSQNFVLNARGAGRTQEVKNFIAQAEAAGRVVIMSDVMKQEMREKFGMDIQEDQPFYVSVPKRQLQDVVDTTMRSYSMGCVTPNHTSTSVQRGPDVCSLCGAIWPCQEHATHLELGWHRDPETGKPVFDEVSMCKGLDPNGLTTLDPQDLKNL